MTAVVFLDIDNVCNSKPFRDLLPQDDVRRISAPGTYDWAMHMDPVNVSRLERLLHVTRAQIVVSSDWRHSHTVDRIEKFLWQRGAPGALVIDRCPDGDRGPSIIDWLAWNVRSGAFDPVESWVALDDCREMGEAEPRTVRTDPAVGLTDADVDRAIAMLGGS